MSPAVRNEIDELKKHATDNDTSKHSYLSNKGTYRYSFHGKKSILPVFM